VLLFFMAATVFMVVRMHNLFAVVMLGGIYSLLAAALLVVLDAVDVAFTEAAVGAGISTVLALGALSLTTSQEKEPSRRPLYTIAVLFVVSVTGAALIFGSLDMPVFGDPAAPIHGHVANVYLAEGQATTGVPNIVTAVLASYRGFDTLGETMVVFTAGIGVLLTFASVQAGRKREDETDDGEGGE
jgi:multicomponent Na+:H+ antiporter subunit B